MLFWMLLIAQTQSPVNFTGSGTKPTVQQLRTLCDANLLHASVLGVSRFVVQDGSTEIAVYALQSNPPCHYREETIDLARIRGNATIPMRTFVPGISQVVAVIVNRQDVTTKLYTQVTETPYTVTENVLLLGIPVLETDLIVIEWVVKPLANP